MSPVVQASPSLQAIVLFVKTHPEPGSQVSVVQTLPSLQTSGAPLHVPPPHVSPVVQALPSSQAIVLFVKTHPVAGMHASVVQALLSLQTTAEPPQLPPAQTSPDVHALPSLHPVPSALAGFEQTPVPVLQVPGRWHWSDAVHTTGFAPVQTPPWQVSVCVQPFASLHPVPFGWAGFEQTPVPVLQTPAAWHWSEAVQTTGFDPVQTPD
jgi:hypothetical protein